MRDLEEALQIDGAATPRASVLRELSDYFACTEAQSLERCTGWGAYFDAEWDAAANPTEFHRTTQSSSFSLLWAAYLQADGYYWPTHVAIAREMARLAPPPRSHLDFAAAVGVRSQIFARLGYTTTLADISTTMLDFARWRFAHRGVSATFIDLNDEELPHNAYDVITATDVLSLLPDFESTVRSLHRALKSDGLLCANILGRPAKDARWQLHDNDLPLRRQLRSLGFEPVHSTIGNTYRKVSLHDWRRHDRRVRDAILFSPLRSLYRNMRGFTP